MKTGNFSKSTILLGSILLICTSTNLMAEKGKHHWTYEGAEGPEHWGALADEFRMCAEGMNQSPVDLVADVHANLPKLESQRNPANLDDSGSYGKPMLPNFRLLSSRQLNLDNLPGEDSRRRSGELRCGERGG